MCGNFSQSIWRSPLFEVSNFQKDRKSTRLNSSHTVIYTLSLHDALPIFNGNKNFILMDLPADVRQLFSVNLEEPFVRGIEFPKRSEEHTSELQSHSDLHSFPTRRSSDLQRQQEFYFDGFASRCAATFLSQFGGALCSRYRISK